MHTQSSGHSLCVLLSWSLPPFRNLRHLFFWSLMFLASQELYYFITIKLHHKTQRRPWRVLLSECVYLSRQTMCLIDCSKRYSCTQKFISYSIVKSVSFWWIGTSKMVLYLICDVIWWLVVNQYILNGPHAHKNARNSNSL